MKRLLVCSSTFPLGPDDHRTARFVYDLAKALATYFEVTAVAPSHPGAAAEEELGPVKVKRFKYWVPASAARLADGTGIMANIRHHPLARLQVPPFLWAFRRAVAGTLRRERFDFVNPHWLFPAGWATARPAARSSVPMLLTVHAADVFLLRRLPGGRRLARAVVANATAIFADSEFIVRELNSLVGFDTGAQATTAGVDAEFFAPRRSPADAKGELGWPDAPAVLYVGKMVEKKGVAYLIRAFAELRKEFPETRLYLVGDGPTRENIMALTEELNLSRAVNFLGPRGHGELRLMYNAADVLAVPSIVARDGETEGMPTVILEAFAAGCPVVGSRVAGIPEFVSEGETGFLAEPGDATGLAAALRRALGAGRDRLAARCREVARSFDFKFLARRYAEAAGVTGVVPRG